MIAEIDESTTGRQARARRAKLIAVASLLLIGVAFSPSMAGAGNPSYCTGTFQCAYNNINYSTGIARLSSNSPLTNVPVGANDIMSSWENRSTSANGAWYWDVNGGGSCLNMPKSTQQGYVGAGNNDRMSSWKHNGAC